MDGAIACGSCLGIAGGVVNFGDKTGASRWDWLSKPFSNRAIPRLIDSPKRR